MTHPSPDFMDLRTRAELLELCNDPAGAARLRAQSLEIAREVDLTCYGYQLLWRHRLGDAIAILEHNVLRHPDSANAWDTLAEAYTQAGDVRRALECCGRAARLVADDEQRLRIERQMRELIALGAMAS